MIRMIRSGQGVGVTYMAMCFPLQQTLQVCTEVKGNILIAEIFESSVGPELVFNWNASHELDKANYHCSINMKDVRFVRAS